MFYDYFGVFQSSPGHGKRSIILTPHTNFLKNFDLLFVPQNFKPFLKIKINFLEIAKSIHLDKIFLSTAVRNVFQIIGELLRD